MSRNVVASTRAAELGSPSRAFLRRMGERSWPGYLSSALITAVAQRRRGVTGLALRRALYPGFFASARRPVVLEDVIVRGPRKIRLGDDVMLEQHVLLDAKTSGTVGIEIGDRSLLRIGTVLDTGYEGRITIGARVEIGAYCEIRGLGGVEIEDGCLFARNVMVMSSTHVFDDPGTDITDQGNELAPVRIEEGAWLGANVVVLGGVVIGRGAIVGANSVVRESLPPGAIAVGAPARVVRFRPGFEPAALEVIG